MMSLSLIVLALRAAGQVAIVPSKAKAPRGANKPGRAGARPRLKPQAPAAGEPEAPAAPAPAPLDFAIVSPGLRELKPASATARPIEAKAEPAAPPAQPEPIAAPVVPEKPAKPPAKPAPAMFEFESRVLTSDARGVVASTGRSRGRYFSEELGGGTVLEMVEVPAGSFLMGASEVAMRRYEKAARQDLDAKAREDAAERVRWEGPQRVVRVGTFYLGKFEVTQAQWRAVAKLPKVRVELMPEPSEFKGDSLPVERVTWEEAVEFCERLTRATGRRYRLPTEAEWEYACRAGTESPFHFGEAVLASWANYQGRYPLEKAARGEFRQHTVAAGSLGVANAFGLYDMHGNVWEWCMDNWRDSYVGAADAAHIAQPTGVDYLKAIRGGGWDSPALECRSSARNRMATRLRLNNIGFRVVAELP